MSLVTPPQPFAENPIGTLGSKHLVQERVRKHLRQNRHPEIRALRCRVHDGVAVVHGRVNSFYMKQLAQTIVLQIQGVETVANAIQVAKE